MTEIRTIVIGVGHMGRFHAQKVAALERAGEGVKLLGVVDRDLARAQAIATELGVPAQADYHAWLATAQAAIVCVPTIFHYDVVRELLKAGLDVLVEKPIAATIAEAEEIDALVASTGRVLQVGHLERFNPALRVMKEKIARPKFIEAHRMGPFPDRATDVDVIRDLMIHDIDIVQQLVGERPTRQEAIGVPVLSHTADIANARLTFPSGCVANLTASRVSPTAMRRLRVFQPEGYFSIDFLTQSAVIFRKYPPETPGGKPRIEMEKLEFDREDALLAQARAFFHAVRTRATPLVTSTAGRDALRTALELIATMPQPEELQ